MEVSYIHSPLSFSKTRVARCSLPDVTLSPRCCDIFEINYKTDNDYFKKLQKNPDWKDSWYMWEMDEELSSDIINERIYVMEDSSGSCLGYMSVYSDDDLKNKKENILYIETNPVYSSRNPKRTLKYVGESLIAFCVGLANKNDVKRVCIPIYTFYSENFYKNNCGFVQDKKREDALVVDKENYDDLLKKNKSHTGQSIEFVG